MSHSYLKEDLANPHSKALTGDGRTTSIIDTYGKTRDYPIIALVEEPSSRFENVFSYTEGGQLISYAPSKEHDLFFAREKHEGWTFFTKSFGIRYIESIICATREEAQRMREADPGRYGAIVKLEWEE